MNPKPDTLVEATPSMANQRPTSIKRADNGLNGNCTIPIPLNDNQQGHSSGISSSSLDPPQQAETSGRVTSINAQYTPRDQDPQISENLKGGPGCHIESSYGMAAFLTTEGAWCHKNAYLDILLKDAPPFSTIPIASKPPGETEGESRPNSSALEKFIVEVHEEGGMEEEEL